jgi:hypothetical protein
MELVKIDQLRQNHSDRTEQKLSQTIWFELCDHWGVTQPWRIALLKFSRQSNTDGPEQTAVVKPFYLFERRVFNSFK